MKLRVILYAMLLVLAFSFSASAAEQVLFYHTDPVGTPLAMTNSSGSVVWKADYKPFGEENSITGAASNDRRFVGKEKDEETGLSYFGARYEDAKTGRFIAVDPVGAVDPKTSKNNEKILHEPQRLNAYAYGLNNPYSYVDLDGRFASHWLLRALVPGQVAFDNALTALENGNYLGAGLNAGSMVAEQVLFSLPFGQSSSLARQGSQIAAKGSESTAETVFKTGHYASRLELAGVNIVRAESAVAKEVNAMRGSLGTNANTAGRLKVDGVLVEYRARLLENGTVNVGSIFPVK